MASNEFPKIKRAEESPTFIDGGDGEEYNGDPDYQVEDIKEERLSRAVWARAIAKQLQGVPEYLWSPTLDFVVIQLLNEAEADEK